ncbi:MAG: RNA polymerase sigma factor [Acidimicrobiales bacterium]|jgi:RNA polymerase sigma-70 factor (ECF subfamily)
MEDEEGRAEFELFFHNYARRLVGEAFCLTGNRQDGQDLAQEVLVSVWQHWGTVSLCDHPEAWARRVMRNLASNRWRRKRLERRHSQLVIAEQDSGPDTGYLDIIEALGRLAAGPRQAMVLHAVVGLSVEEIATELDVPAGTVRSWLHRSRVILAAHIGASVPVAVPGGD